jgi:mRNA-degrading endonuclease YafQ of YafQ-DinJ toxin-antitoxin module
VKFRVVENFWENFYDLRPGQKESVRRAWAIFKVDPFDRRLKTHKIHKLSAEYKATIYSAVIEADLRVIFRIDDDTVTTLDIGTHAIYK